MKTNQSKLWNTCEKRGGFWKLGNGSRNEGYCAFCFEKGRFNDEGVELKIEKLVTICNIKLNMTKEQAAGMTP